MSVRLLIDGRPLVGDRTGIGVHTAEIAARLDDDLHPLIGTHAPVENREGLEHVDLRVDRSPLGFLWQQVTLPRVAEEEAADLVWGPHGTLPLRLKTPAVISLHDLTSITMPHLHRFKTIASFNPLINQSLEMAVRIISVSRFTADETIRGFGVDASKIEVIPNGVSEYFSPGTQPHEGEPMILYAGSIEPRKGIVDLLDAWESLSYRPKLVLAGSSGWRNASLRRRLAPRLSNGEILLTGYVSRERLRQLYREATIVVYPSHFEGFGLPVLEAMACGAPVITTTGGAIPEAAGDAAILVPPSSPEDLARAIRSLLVARERRQELSLRGIERARQFTWSRTASRASEIFRHAVEAK